MSNSLKVVFIGDIVGSSGRQAVKELLPSLKDEFKPDLVIANGENAAHGFGLTTSTAREIYEAGVDFITGGNHSFDKKEIVEAFDLFEGQMIRPANYPPESAGSGYALAKAKDGTKVGVINLMGRVYMDPLDCPFRAIDQIVSDLKNETKIMILDFHGEATSEKMAMGFHCDGKISAVVGTHTHVQTADECVLENGTGFITDLGMTGPHDSVIGMKKEVILYRFLEKRPARMEVANGPAVLQGVVMEFDKETGQCKNIDRIRRFQKGIAATKVHES